MEFAKWLNEKMEEHGLTKYQVAKLAGVHQTTVSKILGGAKPQMETERKIKVALESYTKSPSPKGNGPMESYPEELQNLIEICVDHPEIVPALLGLARQIKSGLTAPGSSPRG